jgi:mannose-6-phosphate isomerase-like protein (cupin superfamily)
MSYPEQRYFADHGVASAMFRPDGHAPEISNPRGTATHYLATGDSTGGAFGLYRWEMGPTAGGPAPHFHKTISESFYILSGMVRLFDGNQWVDATPGDFLFVPEGGIHGFRNESDEPATMLILFAPGAPREDYFETLADAARRDALRDERAAAEFYRRHDTYWT